MFILTAQTSTNTAQTIETSLERFGHEGGAGDVTGQKMYF